MEQTENPLDPSRYIEHVTRTALLLERLAVDVRSLKELVDHGLSNVEGLRKAIGEIERELAVFKVSTTSTTSANKEAIEVLTERLRWLSRLVNGAIVTGVIGALLAAIVKAL